MKDKKDKNQSIEDKIKDFSDLLNSLTKTEDKKKLLWKEAYNNALNDRESASILVNDLLLTIPGNTASHQNLGVLITKYLERMAKCNDQILKLAELIAKEEDKNNQVSSEDIFNEIGD